MKKKVKVLKGLFSGKVGELYDSFNYHGNKIYVIRFKRVAASIGQLCYAFITLKDGEYEVTNEREIIQEIKGL